MVRGHGLVQLLECRTPAGGEQIDLRTCGAQNSVPAAQASAVAPPEGLKKLDRGLGGAGQLAVQLVDIASGLGDRPADEVKRVAGRMVVAQPPGVLDTELLGDQVRAGPFRHVMGVHSAASIRASRERTRVGRLSGPSPIQT